MHMQKQRKNYTKHWKAWIQPEQAWNRIMQTRPIKLCLRQLVGSHPHLNNHTKDSSIIKWQMMLLNNKAVAHYGMPNNHAIGALKQPWDHICTWIGAAAFHMLCLSDGSVIVAKSVLTNHCFWISSLFPGFSPFPSKILITKKLQTEKCSTQRCNIIFPN